MKRNLYLTILILAAVVCIVFGTLYHTGHAGRWNSRAASVVEKLESKKNESAEETKAGDDDTGKIPAAEEEEQKETEKTSVQTEDGGITEIQADLGLGSLTIRPGTEFGSEYTGNKEYKPHVELEDGILKIWQEKKNFSLLSLGSKKAQLDVTIPEGAVLKKADIRLDLGDLKLIGMTIEEGSLNNDLGDIILNSCSLGKLDAECDMGDVKIEECGFQDLTVKQDLGDVDISSSEDLTGAVVDLATSLGSVKINGRGQGTKCYIDGGGEISLYVRNDMGDVRLTY